MSARDPSKAPLVRMGPVGFEPTAAWRHPPQNYPFLFFFLEEFKAAIIRRRVGLGKEPGLNEILEEVRKLELKLERAEDNEDPLGALLRRIVGEDELEGYLAEGWDIQTVLPSGRILIRRLG